MVFPALNVDAARAALVRWSARGLARSSKVAIDTIRRVELMEMNSMTRSK